MKFRPLHRAAGLALGAQALALSACGTLLGDPGTFEATSADARVTPDGDAALPPDARFTEDQFVARDARPQPPDGPPAPATDAALPPPPDAASAPPPDARVTPADAERVVTPDAAPPPADAAPRIDGPSPPLPDAAVPPPPDAALPPTPDAAPPPPDAAPILPDACVPGVEVCDGVDNDCDGATDESDPLDCSRCGLPFAEGLCAYGVFVCVDGALACVGAPPAAGTGGTCNGVDDDCDGLIDEAGDVIAAASPVDAARVAHCAAAVEATGTLGVCPDASVGCGTPTTCVGVACRDACETERTDARLNCAASCAGAEPFQGECALGCLEAADFGFNACLADCGGLGELGGASRWTCAETAAGPACTATVCPEGFKPRGDACVPRVEICNNGVDDDGDTLIDGVLQGPDPCAATFDQRGAPQQMGRCQNTVPGTPCEDSARMATYQTGSDEIGSSDPDTPRMVDLTYRYAMDREEVSIRAYAACVRSGCCLEPVSPNWRRALEVLDAGRATERPEAPDRCARSPEPSQAADAELLPDLPVTGISWCMARDYCNWVGKRLPTEYEWEHAAAGPNVAAEPRRIFPWGDAPPPDCVEAQCCRAEGFDGPLPGACVDGYVGVASQLDVCADADPPAGTRTACLGTYNKMELACQGDVHGPSPVYANADGATPEGLLNLGGNVAEWMFDWTTNNLADLNNIDPVGAGCDATPFTPKRAIRGRDFTSLPRQLSNTERFSMWESSRAPNLGFRCGRTLTDDDTLCDPQMPLVNRDRCLPGASAVPPRAPGLQNLQPCPAPNFDGQDAADLSRCGGNPRTQSDFCDDGISDFCSSDTPTGDNNGCGSFVITRFAVPTGLVGESDGIGLLNAVFESSLATNGGSTLLVLGAPDAFNLASANWPFAFGSADIDAQGRLVWLGTDGPLGCDALPYGEFSVRTVNGRRDLTPVCRAVTRSDIWLREAPVSLAFSALAIEAAYEPADDTMRGTMTLVMTYGDTQRLRLGSGADPTAALEELLSRIGTNALPLCGLPLAFSCFSQPLLMPGCNAQFTCDVPETCMGWGLPFEFEAVRADRAGLPNLRACGP
jgi:formylglycine-generating enzyme required for sulfatase activity